MKVAVLEYLSGSGLFDESALSSLFREGIAMLSGLANDLALCVHEVHTLLDQRSIHAKSYFHPQVNVHSLDSKSQASEWLDQWIALARACDLSIVIAPELDNQLTLLVEQIRLSGAKVLASSTPFLEATSDKLSTATLLSQSNIAHPRTQTWTEYGATVRSHGRGQAPWPSQGTRHSHLPLTLKRRDGAGCADMMVFADQVRLEQWIAKHASHYLAGDHWLVQEWLPGRAASMAILAGQDWQVIGAVEQIIQCDTVNQEGWSPVRYLGGKGPLAGVTDELLGQLAQRVRHAFPGEAAGWIGIDFLVPEDPSRLQDFVVIEINPRLTTSYLGYRKWYGPPLAGALLKTPDNPAFFSAMQKPPTEFSACEFAKNHGET